jgi:hypothetical protein
VEAGRSERLVVHAQHDGLEGTPLLSFEGQPTSVSFTPETAGKNDDVGVNVVVAPDTAPGNYPIVIRSRMGEKEAETSFDLTVAPLRYYLPPGWKKAENAKLVFAEDRAVYYDRILVCQDKLKVPFVFIPADRRHELSDPFYIMENKVSIDEYKAFFDQRSKSLTFKNWIPPWDDGAFPATRVPVDDAHEFARWLVGAGHGFLPRDRQWDKAAGAYEPNHGDGPFHGHWDENNNPRSPQPRIAVNRAEQGPMHCSEATDDVSLMGVHDMAGNGSEWTRRASSRIDFQNSADVPLASRDKSSYDVLLRGHSFRLPRPLMFKHLLDPNDPDYPGMAPYLTDPVDKTPEDTGFRVVLEPWAQPKEGAGR